MSELDLFILSVCGAVGLFALGMKAVLQVFAAVDAGAVLLVLWLTFVGFRRRRSRQ